MPENMWQCGVPLSVQKLCSGFKCIMVSIGESAFHNKTPIKKEKKKSLVLICYRRSMLLWTVLILLSDWFLELWPTRWWMASGLPGPAVYSNTVVIAFLNNLYNSPMCLVHHEIGGKIVRWCGVRIKKSILKKAPMKLAWFHGSLETLNSCHACWKICLSQWSLSSEPHQAKLVVPLRIQKNTTSFKQLALWDFFDSFGADTVELWSNLRKNT